MEKVDKNIANLREGECSELGDSRVNSSINSHDHEQRSNNLHTKNVELVKRFQLFRSTQITDYDCRKSSYNQKKLINDSNKQNLVKIILAEKNTQLKRKHALVLKRAQQNIAKIEEEKEKKRITLQQRIQTLRKVPYKFQKIETPKKNSKSKQKQRLNEHLSSSQLLIDKFDIEMKEAQFRRSAILFQKQETLKESQNTKWKQLLKCKNTQRQNTFFKQTIQKLQKISTKRSNMIVHLQNQVQYKKKKSGQNLRKVLQNKETLKIKSNQKYEKILEQKELKIERASLNRTVFLQNNSKNLNLSMSQSFYSTARKLNTITQIDKQNYEEINRKLNKIWKMNTTLRQNEEKLKDRNMFEMRQLTLRS